jgi:hypothetical protein
LGVEFLWLLVSGLSWGEKMVMMLALRLIFPDTTLKLVLNCDRKFEFSVAHFFYQNQQHGEQTT